MICLADVLQDVPGDGGFDPEGVDSGTPDYAVRGFLCRQSVL
jgi:hypothetical protein